MHAGLPPRPLAGHDVPQPPCHCGDGDSHPGRLPRPGWPAHADLSYIKEAITALLLLLALPWLAINLVRRPGYVLAGAARQHVKPPA
jgi:hypothetical protein